MQGERFTDTVEDRDPGPPVPDPAVASLVPLPRSVLGAATIVAAQGAFAATGAFFALFATYTTRVRYLGHGLGGWRFAAAAMLAGFTVAAVLAAAGLLERRPWARPLAFAVATAVICGYLLTFVFDPLRALFGIALGVGVLALVLGPSADEAFAPVETD